MATCDARIASMPCTVKVTKKRGKAQRVARQACALCDCAFLAYLQTGHATATFNQHSAYISLPEVTTHANEPQDLMSYWTKVHQFFSCRIFFHRRCSRSNPRCDLSTRSRMRGATFKKQHKQNISPPAASRCRAG